MIFKIAYLSASCLIMIQPQKRWESRAGLPSQYCKECSLHIQFQCLTIDYDLSLPLSTPDYFEGSITRPVLWKREWKSYWSHISWKYVPLWTEQQAFKFIHLRTRFVFSNFTKHNNNLGLVKYRILGPAQKTWSHWCGLGLGTGC